MQAVLSNRIYIQVNDLLKKHIEKELTYSIPLRMSLSETRYIKHFDYKVVRSNVLSIPIGRTDLIPSNYEIIDKRTINMHDFHISKYINLRDSQQEIYDNTESNCIIHAGCSFGKTFTALSLIEKLGQKTLVIVHTLKLLDQWVEECKKVLGITPGILAKGKFEIDNPLCIATNKTLLNYKKTSIYKEFGTVIVDECHHIPAKTFNILIDKFHAKYKIGLSATLKRKDEKQFLIFNYITKDNVFTPEKENSLHPEVVAIETDIILPTGDVWANRVGKLIDNNEYISLIYNLVTDQVSKGHKVLTIASRVDLLKRLHDMTEDSGLIISETNDQSEKTIKDLKDNKIHSIYGSTQIMTEGISINELSVLILGTPINNEITLEQAIGRIIRHSKDKKSPVVFDIILKGVTGQNQWRERKKFYKSMGYDITMVKL